MHLKLHGPATKALRIANFNFAEIDKCHNRTMYVTSLAHASGYIPLQECLTVIGQVCNDTLKKQKIIRLEKIAREQEEKNQFESHYMRACAQNFSLEC